MVLIPLVVPEELRGSAHRSDRGVVLCPGLRLRRFQKASCGSWIVGNVVIALILVCSAVVNAASQSSESPTEVVRATITEVFRILEDPKLKGPPMVMPR